MQRNFLKDVVMPVVDTVLRVGTPVALLWTAYTMSPKYRQASDAQKNEAATSREETMRVATSALLGVLAVAGTVSFIAHRRRS